MRIVPCNIAALALSHMPTHPTHIHITLHLPLKRTNCDPRPRTHAHRASTNPLAGHEQRERNKSAEPEEHGEDLDGEDGVAVAVVGQEFGEDGQVDEGDAEGEDGGGDEEVDFGGRAVVGYGVVP